MDQKRNITRLSSELDVYDHEDSIQRDSYYCLSGIPDEMEYVQTDFPIPQFASYY